MSVKLVTLFANSSPAAADVSRGTVRQHPMNWRRHPGYGKFASERSGIGVLCVQSAQNGADKKNAWFLNLAIVLPAFKQPVIGQMQSL